MSIATAPGEMKADAPTCLTTTLYDLMVALHDVVAPHEDALVVALVALWLRTGRIGVPVQSMQKVPISYACRIKHLEERDGYLAK